jgi:REP element-mobilizing transposase RayT
MNQRLQPTSSGWHSRGYLPHFDGGVIPQSITVRLFDSLPKILLQRWSYELSHNRPESRDAELRQRIEAYLNRGIGSAWLRNVRVATIVENGLLFFDDQRYTLSAWVVMPNHAHFIATPLPGYTLSRIIQSLKSYTSNEANKVLKRRGPFWMPDYFDRYIRNEKHFAAAIAYIENNPVKAGLCRKPSDWRFSSARFRGE